MGMLADYRQFLRAKVRLAPRHGFDVGAGEINPALKDFAQVIVRWAAAGGRRGIFSSFGLHKTSVQIELARLALKRAARPLIVVPLGVRQEFFEEAAVRFTGEFAVNLVFIRSTSEMDLARTDVIYLTNYESVRENKIDLALFGFASLDEAAVLRGFGGTKTFREFMRLFDGVNWRFVATATPDPNEFIELLAYAAFLGIMDVGEAKTRFFKRNSEKADKLVIHPHKEREFWLWVASWALFVRKPSDLGFSDEGYVLPSIDVRWHELPSDHSGAGHERDGQGRMFRDAAAGLTDASREKRATIELRTSKLRHIIDEARRSELHEGIPPEEPGEVSQPEPAALSGEQGRLQGSFEEMAAEQSSQSQRASSTTSDQERRQASGTDPEVVPQQQGAGQSAQDQASLRDNDGAVRGASRISRRRLRDLPRTSGTTAQGGPLSQDSAGSRPALQHLQRRARDVRGQSGNASQRDGLPDQVVIWCDLNDEQKAIEQTLTDAGVSCTSLYGNQAIDERDELIQQWKRVETSAFLSKPQMYGAGVNLQQCHTMVFVGIGFKFHDFLQSIHRCYRFGQKQTVTVHLIYTEAEREIRRTLERRWQQHDRQAEIMSGIIREFGLTQASLANVLNRSIGVERAEAEGVSYRLVNNDCVEELAGMGTDSVDLIVTSIPFSTQYEYTPSYNDFGHTDDNPHFWEQMDYLTPQLLRVLEPGRVAAIHVKDRIVPGGINGLGFQTVQPFSDECVAHFRKHGFAFLARKTIVTDVVRENNQTYRLGWTEQCKDGSRMGAGMPEYILLFRKPPTDRSNGYADQPVVKEKPFCDDHGEPAPFDARSNWKKPVPGTGYTRARWQLDAHGFTKSSGNRLLSSEELTTLPHDQIYKLWRDRSAGQVYDFLGHLAVTEDMDHAQRLPSTFMLMPPHSWHPDVWTDVARMRTLNGAQSATGREMHLCPLQFDIVDRLITQLSMPGETVLDPFGGLMTVPYCAVKLNRFGVGIELNPAYFRDGVRYLQDAEANASVPTLFDLLDEAAE